MEKKILTVIVPRLPPSIDGLGDYALYLAQEMYKKFGCEGRFIVGDPKWIGNNQIENFKIDKVENRSAEALLKLLPNEGVVLLHYVGYGYARRGCPLWLMWALTNWKAGKNRKLITMVHECYAFGPPWNSQFWTSPIQRYILRKIVHVSDKLLTSKKSYSEIIRNYSQKKKIDIIPVFSNVGELSQNSKLETRENIMIVFGSRSWREKAYQSESLVNFIKANNIKEIVDVGADLEIDLAGELKKIFVKKGKLSANEVSRELTRSRFGLFNYPIAYLSKSGIFASYCAHGLVPVAGHIDCASDDGIEFNKHFIDLNTNSSMSDLQYVSDQAYLWYQNHNLEKHAEKFKENLD
jgi:predicted CopG family antitoxin